MSAPDRNPAEHENEHPRGALVFILVYLLILVAFWLNTYLRLWIRS